ncbi:SRPBCC family protein [Mariniluteicoccus flavus]
MGNYTVTRSITVDAPAARVLALITDLHRWVDWSPWEDTDPALNRTYSGAQSGVGQRYAWRGNKKAGEGTMEIIDFEKGLGRLKVAAERA